MKPLYWLLSLAMLLETNIHMVCFQIQCHGFHSRDLTRWSSKLNEKKTEAEGRKDRKPATRSLVYLLKLFFQTGVSPKRA